MIKKKPTRVRLASAVVDPKNFPSPGSPVVIFHQTLPRCRWEKCGKIDATNCLTGWIFPFAILLASLKLTCSLNLKRWMEYTFSFPFGAFRPPFRDELLVSGRVTVAAKTILNLEFGNWEPTIIPGNDGSANFANWSRKTPRPTIIGMPFRLSNWMGVG